DDQDDQAHDLEPTPQGEPGPTESSANPTAPPTNTIDPEPTDPEPSENANGDHPDNVLPHHRVLSYYGHPSTGTMGILGEYSKEEVLARLQEEAANYEAADPDTPVKMAFELIATVAQPSPGDDGTYLLYTGDEWIGEYVEFTRENDLLLILDLQIGHDTIPNEIDKIRHWLEEPHVHLALDPEFSTGENPMLPDRVPGSVIGEVDGHHVQEGMEMVADIVEEHDLPNKIFIVHQFEADMIYNKDAIEPIDGVDFVLDMDGFGTPESKIGNYGVFVQQEIIQYGGIKLFYKQDDPLIDPATIVGLEPSPLVVIYQ
ncbi:MAG: hypothetical protein ACOC9Y_05475, partial [Chloroflexota bacterium]